MVTDFYILLIYKELDGSITPAEQGQLDDWSRDASNAQVKTQIESVWSLSDGVQEEVAIDLDADFAMLQEKIQNDSKVVKLPNKYRNWISIAAGLAILVAAFFGVQRFSQVSSELVSHTASKSNQYFLLEDGSEIYLQNGSTISYNQPMDRSHRLINLDGEAVFHVAHDKNWPLDVKTKHETITVLGTKFHVVQNDLSTQIQLIEGRIAVTDSEGKSINELTKGQSLDRNHDTGIDTVVDKMNENRFGWQTKTLKFQNTKLDIVASDLAALYGQTISFVDNNVGNCRLTGSFKDKTLDQIMSVIADIHDIEISREGDTIFWKGGSCE